jgi:hypothetical protein
MNDHLVTTILRCPDCRSPVRSAGATSAICDRCGRVIAAIGGVFDLVPGETNVPEEAFYEGVYAEHYGQPAADLEAEWHSKYYPMNEAVRKRVGDVGGKRILLLGNGTSTKELQFLEGGPALLVYSDLSISGPRAIRGRYFPDGRPNMMFAAIDAERLPLRTKVSTSSTAMRSRITCLTSTAFWARSSASLGRQDAPCSWTTHTHRFGREQSVLC